MRLTKLAIAIILGFGAVSCGQSLNESPSPSSSDGGFPRSPKDALEGESDFAGLIARYSQGQPSRAPWSGYWFPFLERGISDAATKYEQATGKTGAADWELAHHGPTAPGVQSWWGHCNGWSAASVLFAEPTGPVTQNGVTFSIGDQKALLSEISQNVEADFFGTRADTDDPTSPAFEDVFPDQFFLVLTNVVGKGHGLIMDRYTGSQVWNQSIAGYQISPVTPDDDLGADPSAPGVDRVMVTTQVWWLRDDVEPDHQTEPFTFQDGPSYDSRVFTFELWLDGPLKFDDSGKLVSSGNIILTRQGDTVLGGAWHMDNFDPLNSHPDYLWIPFSVAPSNGDSNPNISPVDVESIVGPLLGP